MAAEAAGLELRLRVPLPSERVARVALGALGPDLRPPRQGAPRPHPHPHLEARGAELLARWAGAGPRGLRGGVTSFLELLGLVLETLERFGGVGEGLPPPPSPPFPPSPTPE